MSTTGLPSDVAIESPSTSRQETDTYLTDWSKCVICQEDKSEPLQCPAYSKRANPGIGYKTLAENLEGFKEVGCIGIDTARLDDGIGIEKTLLEHKAS